MILFVPGVMPQPFTDPSYHLPAFYELWARWGPVEDRAFWAHAAEVSRAFFVKTTNPQTGLAPDYANFDGTPRKAPFYRECEATLPMTHGARPATGAWIGRGGAKIPPSRS